MENISIIKNNNVLQLNSNIIIFVKNCLKYSKWYIWILFIYNVSLYSYTSEHLPKYVRQTNWFLNRKETMPYNMTNKHVIHYNL